MFDLDNGICLCSYHHRSGNPSAHKHDVWFNCFLREKVPILYEWAKKHREDYGLPEQRINYKEHYDRLLKIYEECK